MTLWALVSRWLLEGDGRADDNTMHPGHSDLLCNPNTKCQEPHLPSILSHTSICSSKQLPRRLSTPKPLLAMNAFIMFSPYGHIFLFFFFVYDSHRERERGRDIGRGRSRLHVLGARCGIRSGSPGSRPGPKAGAKPLRHPGIPGHIFHCATHCICLRDAPALLALSFV